MNLPSAKELAKLAKACRAAGITSFKGGGIEFTLSDSVPPPKAKKQDLPQTAPTQIESDELGYDALLHWSVIPTDGEAGPKIEE